MRLVVPEIEPTRAHGKLDRVPFVKAEATGDETKRKAGDENHGCLDSCRHVDFLIGRPARVDDATSVDNLVKHLFASIHEMGAGWHPVVVAGRYEFLHNPGESARSLQSCARP